MLLIKKIIDYSIWTIFIVFFLLGFVVYICNRTYPGDFFYPFKQNFVNFILNLK